MYNRGAVLNLFTCSLGSPFLFPEFFIEGSK
jgi:hypothetical protein